MSRKHKNLINITQSIELLTNGYGLNTEVFNDYQFRIRHEEDEGCFDWYHTSGKLVRNANGGCSGYKQLFMEAEEVAEFINKIILI